MRRLHFGNRWIDLATGRQSEGEPLRPTELRLLVYLSEHPERFASIEELHREVWGFRPQVRSRAAYSAVNRLRAVIEPEPAEPRYLLSGRGGYWLTGARRSDELVHRGALPNPLTAFVGRQELLRRLRRDTPRLRTLLGPGGVGKTRLALELARGASVPGGGWWLDLRTLRGGDEVVAAAEATLGTSDPGSLGPALVVVDNAEGVAGLGPLVEGWLARAPELRLLVTSRVPLGVYGEERIVVPPLDATDAHALLSARAAVPVTDEVADELIRVSEGLPLAIEIVAAHAGRASRGQLLHLALPGTEVSLRSVAATSWGLLGAADRAGLAALSTLDGRFDDRAARIALGGEAPDRTLARLLDASWLNVEIEGPTAWFRLLEVLRAFVPERDEGALDRLLAWVEAETARVTQDPARWIQPGQPRFGLGADVHVQLARRAEALPADRRALAVLGLARSAEDARLRSAVEGALATRPEPALAFHLVRWLVNAGVWPADRLEVPDDPTLRTVALVDRATGATRQGDWGAVTPWLEAAEAALPHVAAGARPAVHLRIVTGWVGVLGPRDPDAADARARSVLAEVEHTAAPEALADVRELQLFAARVSFRWDDVTRIGAELLAATERFRPRPTLLANLHGALLVAAYQQLRVDDARRHAHLALDALRSSCFRELYLSQLRQCAWQLYHLDAPESLGWLAEAVAIEPATPDGAVYAALHRSALATAADGAAAGLRWAQQAVERAEQTGAHPAQAVHWLAELLLAVGDEEGVLRVTTTAGPAPLHWSLVDLTRAEVLLRRGDLSGANALATAVLARRDPPVHLARAHAIAAVCAARSGDLAGAERHLVRASVSGYGAWWIALHRAEVVSIRTGEPQRPFDGWVPASRPGARRVLGLTGGSTAGP